ncbi:MAG: DUF3579 domain-containing protein [Thiobacillaceae bacterium]|nr:DUF3579 domain-containing protein [Thiobacillaceae bacterium]MCX7673721.1 DUF3579 domain-containing protein [Thiobacillaceae bacterium]MDW8324881.1 DUF3579 domain-containing protein [Burkholderiales bacterium]
MQACEELVIRGITRQGRPFRPSDWAERLSGLFASHGADNRTRYSPYVYPIRRGGVACVVVSKALQVQEPMVYKFLLDFARDNDLEVVEGRRSARD